MSKRTAHLALYDGAAEMEVGHLLAELHTGRYTGTAFDLVTVADSREPVISMGGITPVPDALLAELDPAESDVLVMPGAEMWDAGGGEAFAAAAARFLEAGVPVAATCGAPRTRRPTGHARPYERERVGRVSRDDRLRRG